MSFELVLAFDTDAPEFMRGFEAGRIWEMMRDVEGFERLVHATNVEMFMRMAEATGRAMTATHIDDTWIQITVRDVA